MSTWQQHTQTWPIPTIPWPLTYEHCTSIRFNNVHLEKRKKISLLHLPSSLSLPIESKRVSIFCVRPNAFGHNHETVLVSVSRSVCVGIRCARDPQHGCKTPLRLEWEKADFIELKWTGWIIWWYSEESTEQSNEKKKHWKRTGTVLEVTLNSEFQETNPSLNVTDSKVTQMQWEFKTDGATSYRYKKN